MSIIDGIIGDDFNEFKSSVLKNKKNLKIVSKRYNMTVFELAVLKNRTDMVEFLLSNSEKWGMNFVHNKINGRLMMSSVSSIPMAELLKKYGFPIYKPDMANVINSLIDMWVTIGKNNLPLIVKWVLENGAKATGDGNNWGPLMNATAGNHTEVMKLLVQYGADINETDWNGRTVIDIVPNNEKTVETVMSFSPILDGKNLKRFATDFPKELLTHPELNKYIDKLILYGHEDILPQELIDIFLF